MSLQTLAFLLGCGLIVIAIVGGGIEAKEVKVPKLSAIPRILSAIFGIGLVVGAVGGLSGYTGGAPDSSAANAAPVAALANSAAPATPPPVAPSPVAPTATLATAVNGPAVSAAAPAAGAPVPAPAPPREGVRTVRLSDELGPGQEYERVQVIVSGRQVGLIALDRDHRRQIVGVEIQEGDEYTLIGSEASRQADGTVRVRTVRGSGTFDGDHSTYILWSDNQTAEIVSAELRGQ
jgi:hypothetical protein